MMTARNTHLGYMHDGDRNPADKVPQEVLPAAVPRQPFQHRDRIQDARKRSYLFNLLTTLLRNYKLKEQSNEPITIGGHYTWCAGSHIQCLGSDPPVDRPAAARSARRFRGRSRRRCKQTPCTPVERKTRTVPAVLTEILPQHQRTLLIAHFNAN
jgi:hypothetical protein